MAIQLKYISDFPSEQAEAIQKHLLEIDEQGKLKEEFLRRYQGNLGKPNSLANYILEDFENRKKLFIEWTGIETFSDKHTIKRTGVQLSDITYGSNKYFLWKCSTCGNEWAANVNRRTDTNFKRGCQACAGNILIKGKNDLETFCKQHSEFMHLLDEFIEEDEKHNRILPSEISRASAKMVWWYCLKCGHEWKATVASRTCSRNGCPACGGHTLIKGVNDLETFCKTNEKFKYILDEFVGLDEDNNSIKPDEIGKTSIKRLQWRCGKCHRIWLTTPNHRTRHKSGCPYCNPIGTSFPEQFIFNSLLQLFPKTQNRQKDKILNYEYDIVIPELNLCIEYSGYNWHQDKLEHDMEKEEHCEENGAQFLQIYGHKGEITDTDGNTAQDTYTPNQIVYRVKSDKSQHIIQLQHIIEYILQEYAPNHTLQEIDFTLAEQQANKVMGKG